MTDIGNAFFIAAKEAVKAIIEKNIHLNSDELWDLIQRTLPGIPKECLEVAVRELSVGD